MNLRKVLLISLPILIIMFGLYLFSTEISTQIGELYDCGQEYCRIDYIDNIGRIWYSSGPLGTGDLNILDGEKLTTFTEENSERPKNINIIAFDDKNRAWIGTRGSGISIFDGEEWRHLFTGNSDLKDDFITDIVFDLEGHAWIGTKESGVSVFDLVSFTNYSSSNSTLKAKIVISDITVDTQGNIWVGMGEAGTGGGGVHVYDGEKWKNYTTENSTLGSNNITVVEPDNQGRIWLGAYGGKMYSFDGDTWVDYSIEMPLEGYQFIGKILFDDSGRGWFLESYSGKVVLYENGLWTHLKSGGGNIVKDSYGFIWTSAGKTLMILDPYEKEQFGAEVEVSFTDAFKRNGGDFFVYLVLGGLWIAALLDSFSGIGRGIGLGLIVFCLSLLILFPQAWVIAFNPGRFAIIGGILGGFIGKIAKREKKGANLGVIFGTIYGICFYVWFMVLGIGMQ